MASGELKAVDAVPGQGHRRAEERLARGERRPARATEEYRPGAEAPGGRGAWRHDKATIESFAKAAHAGNMPPAHVQCRRRLVPAGEGGPASRRRAERHAKRRVAAEDALRAEWGRTTAPNVEPREGRCSTALPKELGEGLKARGSPDGSMLMNNPTPSSGWSMSRGSSTRRASCSRHPAATSTPVGRRRAQVDRQADARGPRAYNKDEKKQQRYRDLLGAYEKRAGQDRGRTK
jgi:hypothetical protein